MPCVSSRELLLPHETRDKKHSMMNADADIRHISKREIGKKMFFIQEYTIYDFFDFAGKGSGFWRNLQSSFWFILR